jgi:foldase protein PrsA
MLIFLLLISLSYAEEQQKQYRCEKVCIDEVVAIVNDKQITGKELFKRLYKLNGQQVLNQMIDELLLLQEAEKQNIDISPDEIDAEIDKMKKQCGSEAIFNRQLVAGGMSIEDLKDQIRLQLLSRKLIIKNKGINVEESDIKAYFDKNKHRLGMPEQIRVRHILVETEREAKDLLIALNAGADFELLAKAKSIDTASKDNGGDIGFFSRGSLVPEFEEAAFALKDIGDISGVVKTQFGYHIIRLEERKEPEPAKLTQEIKDRIKEILMQQKIAEVMPGWLQSLRNNAQVQILIK